MAVEQSEQDHDQLQDDLPADEADIDSALASLPDEDGYIQVKIKDENGDLKYKGNMSPEGFTLDAVRAKFGGGHRYVFDFFAKRARGANRRPTMTRIERRTVYIDKTPEEEEAERAARNPQGLDPQSFATAIAQALSPMYDRIDRLAERVNTAPASSDPAAMMAAMAETMRTLHDMTPKPPRASPETGFDIKNLRELVEVARDITGGEGGGDKDPIAFLEKLIDKIGGPMAAAAQAQTALPSAQLPAAAEPPPHQGERPAANQQTEGVNPMQMYLGMLLQAAAADKNPGNFVGIICDEVPEELLVEILKDPVAQLSRLDPRWKNYESWLMELAEFVKLERAERAKEAQGADPGETGAGEGETTAANNEGPIG